MTQEDKNLLLQDLCGRLPYGIKIDITWWCMGEGFSIDTTLEPDHIDQLLNDSEGETEIKPYLRPMSSMTEEERKEYNDLYYKVPIQRSDGNAYRDTKMVEALHIDWLNKKMFDYRGLIPKGLANAALEGMYNS